MADTLTRLPNRKDRARYLTWLARLGAVQVAADDVQRAQSQSAKGDARRRLEEATHKLDVLSVPDGWLSWEHLGKVIEGARRIPAVGVM